ncbi:FAD-dependent oxidoreductase [Halococcus sp. PRR34]|uniref:NAD(P)/FAD-dependent oxidoreductase n=1 Tax=Halococcus sp. PRR34 TaxID=3020830 RepID=UPI00235E2473|nr:FAD-dependent oxidoreductase [Halococcus sp. PRR34]
MEPSTVAVVGGGAIGVTATAELATRGTDVTLYERGSLAAGSSGRAAGVCYDAFGDRTDARIGTRSLERFRELPDVFTELPYVWLAQSGDEKRADAIRKQSTRMRELGLDVALVDPDDLQDRFPGLVTDDVAVAAIARGAGYAETEEYVEAMAERAAQNGASLRTETAVTIATDPLQVVSEDGKRSFDAVLVAGGAHSKRILDTAGVSIPMKPYRVQALVTETTPNSETVPMCYDATGNYYFRPHTGGLLVGDGTERVESDPEHWKRDADDEFVHQTRKRIAERVRQDEIGVREAWAGLCTATPDGDPLVGEIRSGLFIATGFHGHGFMRAPALGERITDEILGDDGIRRFDPTRFDGNETFEIVAGMDIE